jgi:hypothetical protein
MEVFYPRCAGLDVHALSVTACMRLATGPDVTYQHRTVPTTTRGLLELADWLAGGAVYARRDGGHGGVLEAGLAHPSKGRSR